LQFAVHIIDNKSKILHLMAVTLSMGTRLLIFDIQEKIHNNKK